MAWRIHRNVVRGEIDNRRRGHVTGRVWLAGVAEPIELALTGNCLKDLAGCYLTFVNPAPVHDPDLKLYSLQDGCTGDMTASRKVRIPQVDDDELKSLIRDNRPIPVSLGNCLYLEWFSRGNGRVVIEAPDFDCQISPPKWSMSEDEEAEQLRRNEEELQDFLQNLVNQQSLSDLDDESAEPLDEFQWERLLRESDEMTERYLEALDKYKDDPDKDRLLAEEMGWEWLQEHLPVDDEDDEASHDGDELHLTFEPEMQEHPLATEAQSLAIQLHKAVDRSPLAKQQPTDKNETVTRLLTDTHEMAGKIAAALNSFGESDELEGGYVVATLKRALVPLNTAMAHAETLAKAHPEETDWLNEARSWFLSIREQVLTLMDENRNDCRDNEK